MPLVPNLRPTLLALGLLILSVPLARAEIIYDNSGGTGTNVYYSLLEYGDEVQLGGTGRVITKFEFEYYGDFVATGGETARLRLYRNDGAGQYPSPKTVLWQSDPFPLFAGYQVKIFDGLNITAPGDLTWTVQFSGLVGGNGDEAGLILRNPPSVGSSYYDFWIKTPTGWRLFSWLGNPVANFAAQISSGPDASTVSVSRAAGKVVIQWASNSILQVATSINGPWTDLSDFHNHYEFDPQKATAQFWRLRD